MKYLPRNLVLVFRDKWRKKQGRNIDILEKRGAERMWPGQYQGRACTEFDEITK